jgi:hypothetical protein
LFEGIVFVLRRSVDRSNLTRRPLSAHTTSRFTLPRHLERAINAQVDQVATDEWPELTQRDCDGPYRVEMGVGSSVDATPVSPNQLRRAIRPPHPPGVWTPRDSGAPTKSGWSATIGEAQNTAPILFYGVPIHWVMSHHRPPS